MSEERQWLVPHFWKKVELQLRLHLGYLKVENADADWIVADLLPRFSHIKAEVPVDEDSPVHVRFATMMLDAVTAEQHLFALRMGRVAGKFVSDWRVPGVPNLDHPFLCAFRNALSELEKEAAGSRCAN